MTYRFELVTNAATEQAEGCLDLALLAVESLHGASETRMDASYTAHTKDRVIVIDAHSEVGRDLCRLFAGFLAEECGPDTFHVERIEESGSPLRKSLNDDE